MACFAQNTHHLRISRVSKTTSEGFRCGSRLSLSSVPLPRDCLSPPGAVGAVCAALLRYGGSGGQVGTHRRRHTCGSTATRLTTGRAGSPRHTPPRTGCSWARASPGAAVTGKHRHQLPQAPATSCHSPAPSKNWQQLCGTPAWCLQGAFPRVQWVNAVSVLKRFTSKHPSVFRSYSKRTTPGFW